jgi:hypothetical protein
MVSQEGLTSTELAESHPRLITQVIKADFVEDEDESRFAGEAGLSRNLATAGLRGKSKANFN